VVVPGQPCRWVFEQGDPPAYEGASPQLLLVCVEFLVSLRDVAALANPPPPHLFAHLALSVPGQALLRDHGVLPAIAALAFGDKVPTSALAAATSSLCSSISSSPASASLRSSSSSSFSSSAPPPPPPEEALLAFSQEAAIWAVGCVGSSEPGYQALVAARPDLLKDLLQAATASGDLRLRHAYFLAANHISQTPSAGRPLQTHGWDFGANPRLAVALPSTLASLFTVSPLPFEGSPAANRHAGQLAAPPKQTAPGTVPLVPLAPPVPSSPLSVSTVTNEEEGGCGSKKEAGGGNLQAEESEEGEKADGGGSAAAAAEATKGVVLAAVANLTCALTAAEGKDSLLATQRDFVELAKAEKTAAGAAATTASNSSSSSSEGPPAVAFPSGTVNVLQDASFYVDVFRGPLGACHLGVEHRRLVHHLFRNADFST